MNAQNETSVRVNMMHDPQKHRGLCPRQQCEVSSVHLMEESPLMYGSIKWLYTQL